MNQSPLSSPTSADLNSWQHRGLGLVLCLMICLSPSVAILACQVPVFRYALERWTPDKYNVLVLSHGPLSDADSALIEQLKWSKRTEKTPLVDLRQVDLDQTPSATLEEAWQSHSKSGATAVLVVNYPSRTASAAAPAYTCPLTAIEVDRIRHSKTRDEIVQRLTQGDSAVWVLVQSGDQAKDQAAREILEQQLQTETKRLVLPSAEEMEIPEAVLEEAKIKLKIGFSVVTLRRDDPDESFLIRCLLGSEPDLDSLKDEPMVFPVFGRGIVLYAIVGKGISAEIIREANSFIVGPCSCQVKEQNPGFDLLCDVDWDAAIGDALVSVPTMSTQAAPKLRTIPPGKTKK